VQVSNLPAKIGGDPVNMDAIPVKRTPTRQKVRLAILFFMLILFPVLMNYFSVFLIIEGSAQGIMVFSFFFWTAWVVLALFLGRTACGWVCPLGAYQETKDRMVSKSLHKVKYLRVTKYILAVAWVGAIIWAAVSAGGYTTVNLLYNTELGVSIDRPEGWFTWGMIVIIILLPVFFLGRRGFCHYFCPWGVLNITVTRLKNFFRIPSLHLRANKTRCKQCQTCTANCPMSLPVMAMVQSGSMKNDECILCGTCADNCPGDVIRYSWHQPD
jgi:polyferredoxin